MDYAPEYSPKEKRLRVLLLTLLTLVLWAFFEKVFQPILNSFVENPHCYELFGYNGADYFWHLFIVGIPLSITLILAITVLPLGIRGLREGQFPPKGMKVFKPTPIRKDWKGKLQSTLLVALPISSLLVCLWGYLHMHELPEVDITQFAPATCQIPPSPK